MNFKKAIRDALSENKEICSDDIRVSKSAAITLKQATIQFIFNVVNKSLEHLDCNTIKDRHIKAVFNERITNQYVDELLPVFDKDKRIVKIVYSGSKEATK